MKYIVVTEFDDISLALARAERASPSREARVMAEVRLFLCMCGYEGVEVVAHPITLCPCCEREVR